MATTSLVAAWGDDIQTAWNEILADQYPQCDRDVSVWCDDGARCRIAAVRTRENDTSNDDIGIANASNCTAVFEGALAADIAPRGAEAAIAAYLRWGDECAAHLVGEFAFVLWDGDRRRFLVACDALGGRSLAYFFDGQTFLASSRALALLRHPAARSTWDEVFLAHVLGGRWAQAPGATAFRSIRRTIPGRTLVLERGKLTEKLVAPTSRAAPPARIERAKEEFWDLLGEATRARFDDAATTGLALSGGLDSSCVGAALAERSASYHAFSFTSAANPDLDETPAIRAFCKHHRGVVWHPIRFDEAAKPQPAWLADDPVLTADPLRAAFTGLMQAMHDAGFTSALDGEGGDELFHLSPRIGDFATRREWLGLGKAVARQPRKRRIVFRGIVLPRLPTWGRRLWNRREHAQIAAARPWLTRTFLHDAATAASEEQAELEARIDTMSGALDRILAHPFRAGTRAWRRMTSAATGVEWRSPMLDARIVEFARALPPEFHFASNQSKAFLRIAGAARLPREVLDRQKDNALYERLVERALTGASPDALLDGLLRRGPLAAFVNRDVVHARLGRLSRVATSRTETSALYSLLATARWMQAVASEYGF
jgi:asparagine synthase (glutamine-hydrolysing)